MRRESARPAPLRILIVDGRDDGAAAMALILEEAGYDIAWRRVDREALFAAALHPALDAVLADCSVPSFDVRRALELVQERGLDVPFIAVGATGAPGAEAAGLECLQAGAAGYLPQDRLGHLPSALGRALADRRVRRAQEVAGEAVRRSDARFRLAFSAAPIGMAIVAPHGRFLDVNPALCRIVGYGRQALLRRTFQDITHPDDLDADLDNVARMLAGEITAYSMEKRYVHAAGHEVWINLSVSLARGGAGQPLYFISQIEDITARRADQAALLRADELKDQFLAVTAHELRTPLTAIVGNAELLHREWDRLEPGERLDCCATLERQAGVLRGMVEDLLTLSALEAGKVDFDVAPMALSPALDLAVAACGLRGAVEVSGAAGVSVVADARRLEQILTNYLTNARKHGAAPIGIDVTTDGRSVEVRITDRGPGVPADFVPALFQKFSQAGAGRPRARGCGLGLAIVRSLAERQGGSAWYEPRADGGACFAVRLPAAPARAAVPSAVAGPARSR